MKKEKKKEIEYEIPIFAIVLLIFSVIAGFEIGWMGDNHEVKISLFGLVLSLIFYDVFKLNIKKGKVKLNIV